MGMYGYKVVQSYRIVLHYMDVSVNRGTPTYTLEYCNPYQGDLQNGTPQFWEPPILGYRG